MTRRVCVRVCIDAHQPTTQSRYPTNDDKPLDAACSIRWWCTHSDGRARNSAHIGVAVCHLPPTSHEPVKSRTATTRARGEGAGVEASGARTGRERRTRRKGSQSRVGARAREDHLGRDEMTTSKERTAVHQTSQGGQKPQRRITSTARATSVVGRPDPEARASSDPPRGVAELRGGCVRSGKAWPAGKVRPADGITGWGAARARAGPGCLAVRRRVHDLEL